eukprot:GHVT01095894.1.p1 GENE.GHVT01095894.1~~GHVT01095894.1.p1  ORF type:complete len:277 (-),score=32.91 GHVT01095894.1:54-884(-)
MWVRKCFCGNFHRPARIQRMKINPQGGGQPTDIGYVVNQRTGARLDVTMARMDKSTSVIELTGQIQSKSLAGSETKECSGDTKTPTTLWSVEDNVEQHVDLERRLFNSRLHSAGHAVDVAVQRLNLPWKPSRGYHFANGPYVEYVLDGDTSMQVTPENKLELQSKLETACRAFIEEGQAVGQEVVQPAAAMHAEVDPGEKTMGVEELADGVSGEQEQGPAIDGTAQRMVTIGGVTCPCAGTHVLVSNEIGAAAFRIRKLDKKKNTVRVCYMIDAEI